MQPKNAKRADVMKTRVQDPVCGMDVAEDSAHSEVSSGQTYSFCSRGCQEKFRADAAKYTSASAAEPPQAMPAITVKAAGKDLAKDVTGRRLL
jgi:Cu+-exporting ATPase